MVRSTRLLSAVAITAAFGIAMTGCDPGPASAPPTSPAAAPTSPSGCAVQPSGPVDEVSVLKPGPINGLPASEAVGQPLTIVATVLEPGCQAASDAEIVVWHTDARGLYGPGAGTDECCYYGGTVRTDANGRFELDTIRPAQYPQAVAPPAHIHFEMRHSSGRLDTEIVFDAGSPDTGPVRPSNVIPVVLTQTGERWHGEVTFVLGS
jgi:protocatechuate 3,4-dioxygenase beta subunit